MKKTTTTPEATPAPQGWRIFALSLFLSLFVLSSVFALSACSQKPSQENVPSPSSDPVINPSSHEEVYDAITRIIKNQESRYSAGGFDTMMKEGDRGLVMEESTSDTAPLANSSSTENSSTSYSETNVQVAGIDEGDIVKTDGSYLYFLSNYTIIIAQADGSNTQEVSRITISPETFQKSDGDDYSVYPRELYVGGDTLMIVYEYTPPYFDLIDPATAETTQYYPSYQRSITEVACFDIRDRTNPSLINTFGQDGRFSSSRLQDGILYLISNYWIPESDLNQDDPTTYIPLSYTGTKAEIVPVSDICIFPDNNSTTYTVVSAINVREGTQVDQQSILGSSDTIYMSPDSLYLAGSVYKKEELNSYQDGSFTITEYTEGSTTHIAKLSLVEGKIDFVAETSIAGVLINQFALDEYAGNLRLVTTVDSFSYRSIRDAKGEITDHNSYEYALSTNNLYILNDSLQVLGSLEGLAEDERVYSVRFDGEVGYFVTFRQVDPLFAVDLSDPHNPEIKSALKIPGFSNYLHVFSENRLFGIGMSADQDGVTEGLKLSMFDTSDPYNVSEKHMLKLDNYYSEALYNHKAILVDAEHNLIGFPSEKSYMVYGYSDEEGFYLRGTMNYSADTYYYSTQRGLYIDTFFYLCAENDLGVYNLDTFETVLHIPLETAKPDYGVVVPYEGIEE